MLEGPTTDPAAAPAAHAPRSVLSSSFRPTLRGVVFIGLTLAVGYAALHKGNNLLFTIFAGLAAVLVTSLILTLAMPRRIELARLLPDAAHAGETFAYAIRVRNPRRFLPLFCLRLEDHFTQEGRSAPPQPGPVWLTSAAPRERVRVSAFATVHQRGWVRFTTIDVTSEFPPGLFTMRRTYAAEDRLLAFPRQAVMQRRVLNPYLSRVEFLDLSATATTRGSEDFAGAREYRPGDNPRWIHWRLSARAPGRLLVREFEDTRVRDAVILLDTLTPMSGDLRRVSRLERAICFSAALADALLAENYLVRFRAFGPERMDCVVEPRPGALGDLSRALAVLRPSRLQSVAELLHEPDAGRDEIYFLLRISDDPVRLPVPPERLVEIHADDMRSLMQYVT